ncbi:MAG: DUF4258 domain-containing protein [Bryobacteraceae bacterium]
MSKAPVPDEPLQFIKQCVSSEQIRWTYHVAMRLQQRSLRGEMLVAAVESLEIVETYPEDKYLPSFLIRGEAEGVVFHAQIATDVAGDNVRVVTMYAPEPDEWDEGFRVRRKWV